MSQMDKITQQNAALVEEAAAAAKSMEEQTEGLASMVAGFVLPAGHAASQSQPARQPQPQPARQPTPAPAAARKPATPAARRAKPVGKPS